MSGFQVKRRKPDVRFAKPDENMSGFQTLFEIRTIQQPEALQKRRNPDVRISDSYCTGERKRIFTNLLSEREHSPNELALRQMDELQRIYSTTQLYKTNTSNLEEQLWL